MKRHPLASASEDNARLAINSVTIKRTSARDFLGLVVQANTQDGPRVLDGVIVEHFGLSPLACGCTTTLPSLARNRQGHRWLLSGASRARNKHGMAEPLRSDRRNVTPHTRGGDLSMVS